MSQIRADIDGTTGPASAPARCPLAVVLAVASLLLSACAQFPELASTITDDLRDSDYPELVPLDQVIVPLPPPSGEAETLAAELSGRRDALRRKARELSPPVLDEQSRDRIDAAGAD